MPLKRIFLGTSRPALPAAADYLFQRFVRGSTAEMRRAIVVTTGRRAGRRLLEILVQLAESRGLMLIPPEFETVGALPEQLYVPKRPFATELTQRLAWSETLRGATVETISPVIRFPPDREDTARWMELGDLLRRQHAELAADGLHFGDVLRLGRDIKGFTEAPRWRSMRALQEAYLRRLDELEVWDLQTARLVAVERAESRTDRDLILIGTVDLTVTLRRMLDQVAEQVTALVFAPEEWKDRFDEHGCLVPAAWRHAPLPLVEDSVSVVDGPAEQADTVVRLLSEFNGKYRADELVIGVPDADLVPDLQRVLASNDLTGRWGTGIELTESAPVRFLHAVAEFLENDRFADFAALVRHPDVEAWLARRGVPQDYLAKLDEYHQEHVPYRLDGQWLGPVQQYGPLRRAWDEVTALVLTLRQPRRKLTDWSAPIFQLLSELYMHRVLDRHDLADRVVLTAIESVREALQGYTLIPPSLMPTVAAPQAMRWLLDEVRRTTVPPPIANNSIEMLGWLELPLDDAPALIVTSFNEGFVPESVNSDLFLPNALRRQIGVLDNERRYARDAYAVSVLAATHDVVRWIVARRTRQGDPAVPSRLLFAVEGEVAARRALQFFRPSAEPTRRTLSSRSSTADTLAIPRPRPLTTPIASLRITSFRDYLACPYRFYLKHVLGLETLDDRTFELDGGAFGSLVHDALLHFGRGKQRDSTDPEEIRQALNHGLNQCTSRDYGPHAAPAVQVQIEQARLRLNAFAERQSQWAQQGWRIEHTEVPTSSHGAAELVVDGIPMRLHGRIDRIDVHAETGERVIWDYKTSESGDRPEQTHQRRDTWVDLQLPLYRHLAKSLGITGPVRLGYITLPQNVDQIDFRFAEWSPGDLDDADEIAREVVRAIRREEFWPPSPVPPDFADDFAPVCQDKVLVKVNS